jgi:long-chain fatty acid transport protein
LKYFLSTGYQSVMHMKFRFRNSALLITALAFTSPSISSAGGLYISEFMTPDMGTAGAGREAYASDATTASGAINPAGMSRLEGSEIAVGAGVLIGRTEFDADAATPFAGDDGGNQAGLAPVAGAYGVHKITDDLAVGLTLFSISGAALDPRDSWAGRYQVKEVELLTFTINPAVSYRINDHLSIGAGLTAMYVDLTYKLGAPPGGVGHASLTGDDIAYGYNFGALVELSDSTRVGLTYISKHDVELDGDLNLRTGGGAAITGSASTKFTFPQTVRFGAYHELNDKWALLGSAAWENWSQLDEFGVTINAGSAAAPTYWDDTYRLAAGVHYRPYEDWLFQTGISYDSSPVSAGKRTAMLPIDRQIRIAAGVQHQLSARYSIGGAIEYVDLGDARIDSASLQGEYSDNYLIVAGINFSYKF